MKVPKKGGGSLPAYVIEYLKLQEFEKSWGSYHCTHVQGSKESYAELRAQRERFRLSIEAEIDGIRAALAPHDGLEQVKKAAAAFEKLLDTPTGLPIRGSKAKAVRKGRERA